MEPQVVVNVRHLVYKHSQDEVFSVRCAALGLSAYGDSENEAVDNFKQLFNRFISTYREKGRLQEVLDKSAVEWWWRDDYPADRSPFEDTGVLSLGALNLKPELLTGQPLAWKMLGEEQTRDFAIAA